MAGCNNVETYCAAQVFYWIGYDGMLYVLNVFVADTSSLKNRALMFAYTTSPYIVTAWIGGPASTSFLGGAGWRWAYGTFAIVIPVVSAPLIILFTYNFNKAKRAGLVPERRSDRTTLQSLKYYAIEFDRKLQELSFCATKEFSTYSSVMFDTSSRSALFMFLLTEMKRNCFCTNFS